MLPVEHTPALVEARPAMPSLCAEIHPEDLRLSERGLAHFGRENLGIKESPASPDLRRDRRPQSRALIPRQVQRSQCPDLHEDRPSEAPKQFVMYNHVPSAAE